MKVSAICLSRGDQFMLYNALRCWRAQHVPFIEKEFVVVHDSGQSLAVDGVRVEVEPGTNLGVRRNAGLRAATGDVVIVWDDDDEHNKNRLRLQLQPLMADAVASVLRDVELEGPDDSGAIRRAACPMLSGWPQTLCVRRDILLKHGGWPETELFDGDSELLMTLQTQERVQRINGSEMLYTYRNHGSNVTSPGHWNDLWNQAKNGVRRLDPSPESQSVG